jgi:outer membrane receptor for ferrienterochelin and colicin
VVIEEWPLDAEQSWNWGVNYTYTLAGDDWSAYLSADYYQTRFSNQFFPDYDRELAKAFISNAGTPALSNAFQLEGRINWNTVWELKAAYNYLDIRRDQAEGEVFVPFIPRHRMMAALSYRPEGDRWYFDLNAHYYGPQRLPSTQDYPLELQRGDFSPDYATLNAQITYKWSVFEFYGGIENALDFRQRRPILNYQNPFESTFDPAFIWGPTRGREFYLGIRYRIP